MYMYIYIYIYTYIYTYIYIYIYIYIYLQINNNKLLLMTSGVHKCCRLEKSHKNRAHAMQSPDSPISEVGLQDFEDASPTCTFKVRGLVAHQNVASAIMKLLKQVT